MIPIPWVAVIALTLAGVGAVLPLAGVGAEVARLTLAGITGIRPGRRAVARVALPAIAAR